MEGTPPPPTSDACAPPQGQEGGADDAEDGKSLFEKHYDVDNPLLYPSAVHTWHLLKYTLPYILGFGITVLVYRTSSDCGTYMRVWIVLGLFVHTVAIWAVWTKNMRKFRARPGSPEEHKHRTVTESGVVDDILCYRSPTAPRPSYLTYLLVASLYAIWLTGSIWALSTSRGYMVQSETCTNMVNSFVINGTLASDGDQVDGCFPCGTEMRIVRGSEGVPSQSFTVGALKIELIVQVVLVGLPFAYQLWAMMTAPWQWCRRAWHGMGTALDKEAWEQQDRQRLGRGVYRSVPVVDAAAVAL